MELIDGRPLDELLRERGGLPAMEAIRLIRQAAEGLALAHKSGIVHRDVKPSNLIVDGRGTVKLVDFGIARVTQAQQALTGAAALMGTPGYMAPEQAAGKPVDGRADIYALGLTLFELLSGRPPYQADDPISLVVKNMQEPLPDLRLTTSDLPEELVQLVESMAQKNPDDRLQSCEAVLAALDEVSGRLKTQPLARAAMAVTDRVPPTNVQARRAEVPAAAAKARPNVVALVAAGATVLVLAGAGVILVGHKRSVEPATTGSAVPVARPDAPTPGPVVQNARPTPPTPRTGQGKAEGPLRVAVLKFKNVGADARLNALEQGIGESALTSLANASKDVTLIERADIDSDVQEIDRGGDVHFDPLTVAKAGQLKGIELAVQGGFQRVGQKVRITARLVRVETGEILDTLQVTRPAGDVFEAQDAVAAGLRQKLIAVAEKEKR
jgi:serine/threonine-protein kinase